MGWRPVSQGRNHEGEKVSTHSEIPSWAGTEKLQNLKGELSNRCLEGKMDRIHHRVGCRLAHPSPRHCWHTCRGTWGLGAEAQASEVRPQGEDGGCLP